jgi:hypothetical protein
MLTRGTPLICVYLCSSVVLPFSSGCAAPNKVNIELRKQNQALRSELETLKRQREADAASIAAMQRSPTSVPLAPTELDKLYTTAGLELGKLTGGYENDAARPGDDAIRVQAVPIDAEGDPIKASGAFLIEAFDLSGDAKLLGRWEFDVSQARRQWHGAGILYCYLFTLPLSQPPASPQITLKVTFTDELTGRQFTQQRPISLRLTESAR